MIPSENPIASQHRFPTWRTVRRGVYKTLGAYLAAMNAGGYKFTQYANQMLSMVIWAREEGEEELVLVLDMNLGLTSSYVIEELFAAAARFDLYPLDADVAAGLRGQYDDQPIDEWCLAAMDPIVGFDRDHRVFELGQNSDGHWLSVTFANPKDLFHLGSVWIFSRRKPASAT